MPAPFNRGVAVAPVTVTAASRSVDLESGLATPANHSTSVTIDDDFDFDPSETVDVTAPLTSEWQIPDKDLDRKMSQRPYAGAVIPPSFATVSFRSCHASTGAFIGALLLGIMSLKSGHSELAVTGAAVGSLAGIFVGGFLGARISSYSVRNLSQREMMILCGKLGAVLGGGSVGLAGNASGGGAAVVVFGVFFGSLLGVLLGGIGGFIAKKCCTAVRFDLVLSFVRSFVS